VNKKILIAGFAAAMLVSTACSSPSASTTTNNPPVKPATATTPAPVAPAPVTPTTVPATSQPSAAGAQDFTLVNATGVDINAVHISPHSADNWQEDILGQDTLPNGKQVDIHFNRGEKAAMWDLRIEDKAGNPIEWENLNLLEISKLTLRYANNKATADIE
jgi:hypothetical protein